MVRRPPRSTRPYTPCPYSTLFRSKRLQTCIAVCIRQVRIDFRIDREVFQAWRLRPIREIVLGRSVDLTRLTADLQGRIALDLVIGARRGALDPQPIIITQRSEERRVGQEGVSPCRSRWSQNHKKK